MFDILVTVKNICKYIRIKGFSYFRLLCEIQFVYKFIMTIIVGLAVFMLLSVELQVTAKSVVVSLCVFVFQGMSLCAFSFPEKMLLKTLGIKINTLLFIRLLLLSIPFFLLNVFIGLIIATIGSLFVISLQGISFRKSKRLPAFYMQTSYQWLSSFRRGGLWIQSAGFLLFAIALFQGNENMLNVAFGWLMCAPCFMSYCFNIPDSRFWLVSYRSVGFLLKSKLVELLLNTSLPALICLPLVAIFMPAALILFLKLFAAFLFIDLLIFYSYYLCYPSILMPFICLVFLISTWSAMMLMHPEITVIVSAPALLLLHILTIQNLKSILYATPAP